MPLYEYECFLCGYRFERIRKVADATSVTCPACGGKVRRLLGVPALQFKGSGWYVTDYGKGAGAAEARKETPSATEPKETASTPAKETASTSTSSESTASSS